jgi:uncharacterized BrkB/YihY/UPF0761 family membrane protein
MSAVAQSKPSSRSVLMLASIAGACWLVAAASLALTVFFIVERNSAHGAFAGIAVLFGFITIAAVGVGAAFSVAASSKLRILLGGV